MQYRTKNKKSSDNKLDSAMRWIKFTGGVIILTGMIIFFSSGYAPPGVFGEVLRHNQEYNIDASPFFFGDVENMAEYEDGVRLLRQRAEKLRYSIEQ